MALCSEKAADLLERLRPSEDARDSASGIVVFSNLCPIGFGIISDGSQRSKLYYTGLCKLYAQAYGIYVHNHMSHEMFLSQYGRRTKASMHEKQFRGDIESHPEQQPYCCEL